MKHIFAIFLLLMFSTVAWAGCTCVDLNGDGDTDDFGECICVEDDPVNEPEVPEPKEPVEDETSSLNLPALFQDNNDTPLLDFLFPKAHAASWHTCHNYYWPNGDQVLCPWGYRYLDPCSMNNGGSPVCYEDRSYILNNLCTTAVRCD